MNFVTFGVFWVYFTIWVWSFYYILILDIFWNLGFEFSQYYFLVMIYFFYEYLADQVHLQLFLKHLQYWVCDPFHPDPKNSITPKPLELDSWNFKRMFTLHCMCVKCQVSFVSCHLSPVTCHLSHVTCHTITFYFLKSIKLKSKQIKSLQNNKKKKHKKNKVVELVGGGTVINKAYPVYFFFAFFTKMLAEKVV